MREFCRHSIAIEYKACVEERMNERFAEAELKYSTTNFRDSKRSKYISILAV